MFRIDCFDGQTRRQEESFVSSIEENLAGLDDLLVEIEKNKRYFVEHCRIDHTPLKLSVKTSFWCEHYIVKLGNNSSAPG
jgi:hypothetical protein